MQKEKNLEEDLADASVEIGFGSVYTHLQLKDHKVREIKSDLVLAIAQAMKKKKLTQTKAAVALGLSQPKLSDLLKGRTRGYSVERLIGFLNTLGLDVKLVISPKPRNRQARFQVYQEIP